MLRILMLFQSTLPRREWLQISKQQRIYWVFQSTLPRREWLKLSNLRCQFSSFQSTLPRREWPSYGVVEQGQALISIHTPTQGVTFSLIFFFFQRVYFNPHSHAGSDTDSSHAAFVCFDFNPHSHAGSDYPNELLTDKANFISIHTPTQGVTKIYLVS